MQVESAGTTLAQVPPWQPRPPSLWVPGTRWATHKRCMLVINWYHSSVFLKDFYAICICWPRNIHKVSVARRRRNASLTLDSGAPIVARYLNISMVIISAWTDFSSFFSLLSCYFPLVVSMRPRLRLFSLIFSAEPQLASLDWTLEGLST